MSLEEAQKDPDWHVMSNWLGFESYRVATYRVPVEPGDRFLLCTEGLTNMLDDDQIAEVLAAGTKAVESVDPDARTGLVGCQMPGPSAGTTTGSSAGR